MCVLILLILDKTKYISFLYEQEGINKTLITVEANQAAISAKLDAIANLLSCSPLC